jgi:hypothetical protein
MFRGHVPPVQASKARAILNLVGQKVGLFCEYVRSQSRPSFFVWSGWDAVGTAM